MGQARNQQTATRGEPAPVRRKAQRSPVASTCRIRSAFGDIARAELKDISIHGCNIDSVADWLLPGRFIAIRIDSSQPLQAIVRWARKGSAGLEFLREIPADRDEWIRLID